MPDAARWSIGFLWATAAVFGWLAARRRHRLAAWLLLALGMASGCAAALRWHVLLHQQARDWLHGAGLYQHRSWLKALLAIALVGVVATACWLLPRALRALPNGIRTTLLTMLLWACYLTAYTAFLDDLLPASFAHWPVRQMLEAVFAVVAFTGVLVARRPHAGAR